MVDTKIKKVDNRRDYDLAKMYEEEFAGKKSILDVGCGTGIHLFPFLGLGFERLVGIDIDEKLEQCRKEFNEAIDFSFDKELDFLNYDDSQEFDVIMMNYLLHFVEHDKQLEYVRKAKELLNPGGVFLFMANSLEHIEKKFLDNMQKIDRKTYKEKTKFERTIYLLDEADFELLTNEFVSSTAIYPEAKFQNWDMRSRKFICRV